MGFSFLHLVTSVLQLSRVALANPGIKYEQDLVR